MKIHRLLILPLLLVLIFSSVVPYPAQAAAGTPKLVKLQVANKSGAVVSITLKGPANYTFVAPSGSKKFDLQVGKYTYSYTACNKKQSGKLDVKAAGGKLVIAACALAQNKKGAQEIKVSVDNQTGSYITLYMKGPKNYTLSIKPGKSSLSLLPGSYTYTGYGCGASTSGSVKIRKGLTWSFWCQRY